MAVPISKRTTSLLQAVPYFRDLDEETLHEVAQEVVVRRHRANEIIFLEADPDAGLHLVAEGLCKVYRLSAEGREQVLATLQPGDSCNEVPVVDGGPNPANFAAIEDSVVWVISGKALARLRRRHPILNDIIIKNLARRCRQLVQRVYNLSFLSVTGRLAAFLLQQSAEDGKLSRRWTQDEIAAHLGTVREMVGRALRELQEAGLITVDRHHRIEILDHEGLKELT
jgi:CRP/FNR family cyclic AMP-dependent transcriptional regulator